MAVLINITNEQADEIYMFGMHSGLGTGRDDPRKRWTPREKMEHAKAIMQQLVEEISKGNVHVR